MKKNNNKYRNNNNQIYSLNYKFDSCSIAGKISGTALDLIKKYNELAKEAHSNNDYVNAEIFRQYAEHYRKIVTDINEKRNQNNFQRTNNARFDNEVETAEDSSGLDILNSAIENDEDAQVDLFDSADEVVNPADDIELGGNVVDMFAVLPAVENKADAEAPAVAKKSFTVIEISPENAGSEVIEAAAETAPRRKYVRKKDLAV
ncbi:MAG: DUF4167 domain-containing protein [Alphaproteobacteria bacterium]|nr:DUF4167 domain-containing protein [Alphaproteobacteria bacterium]MBQ8630582.1 DUF4167 domain-containing protein [Alphaproteobacteria bacterium]